MTTASPPGLFTRNTCSTSAAATHCPLPVALEWWRAAATLSACARLWEVGCRNTRWGALLVKCRASPARLFPYVLIRGGQESEATRGDEQLPAEDTDCPFLGLLVFVS